ncbi:MAG: alanine racemase [Gammaproteobacteria bacterium]
MNTNHNVTAHIDLNALHFNLNVIKGRQKRPTKILAMVKGNAYGHGSIGIAKALENEADLFGVACLDEALRLREAGIDKELVVLMGFFDAEDLKAMDQYHISTVIHNQRQLDILEKTKLQNPLSVWLKVDTGMHRLGFPLPAVRAAYDQLQQNPKVIKPFKMMTHFSDADNPSCPKTKLQIERFLEVTKGLEAEVSLANSSAIINWPDALMGYLRPGISMYGVSPMESKTGLELGLKPVMTLTARIVTVHNLAKGETVGYGSTWACPEPMRVGIVSAGYGDGYARLTKTGAPVLINDVKCQLIGRVAMDMITVDLRNCPSAQIGDKAILWGQGLPIEEVALHTGTVPYELFCRLTSRIHYEYHP